MRFLFLQPLFHLLCERKNYMEERVLERNFQSKLIREIKNTFPGCMVLKLDADYIQGIPDLLILYKNRWATLEVKRSANARRRPNQEYYVRMMDNMSFSRFIYPENKEDILNELFQSFQSRR